MWIIFSIDPIFFVCKMSKQMYPNCLFSSTNSPQPKQNQFSIIYDRDEQQIFTSEKLEPENVDIFAWKMRKDS